MSHRREIGPGSRLWHFAGDHRMAFTGLSAGLLQLLHPAIGAGVVQHSDFFNDPWDRIVRSVPQIMGVIYDPEPERIGHRVRDYHRRINGRDDRDRPYRALDPDTFWWAHATFQSAVEQVADRFDAHRLRPPEREELYLDGVEWYRRYGVSMQPVPADRVAFGEVWDHIVDEQLELNPAAERAIDMALHSRPRDLKFLPAWTRPLHPVVVGPVLRLCAVGGLPEAVRRRFAIPWRVDEEVEYRMFQLGVRELFRVLPASRRYGRTATRGYQARRRLEQAAQAHIEDGAA